jgi:predicted CopG family antitoxin
VSTSIRISESTKRKLEALKRDDETFDDLLDRLAVSRTEAEVREMAGFGGEGVADGMGDAREDLNESLEARSSE